MHMPDSARPRPFRFPMRLSKQIIPLLILVYTLLVVLAFVIIPLEAFQGSQPVVEAGGASSIIQALPTGELASFFLLASLTGLLYLISGMVVFTLRPSETVGQVYAVLCAASAMSLMGLLDQFTTSQFTILWTASLALVGGTLIHLSVIFPEEGLFRQRLTAVVWLGYAACGLLAANALIGLGRSGQAPESSLPWQLIYAFNGFALVFFLAVIAYRRRRSTSPILREQSLSVLAGALAFVPPGVFFLFSLFLPGLRFTSYLLLPLALFPVTTGYAILRCRMLNTELLLSRTLVYGLLSLMAGVGYVLLIAGIALLTGETLPLDHPFLLGLLVGLLVLVFNPLRTRLQAAIDKVFFRGSSVFQAQQQAFGQALTQAMELPQILSVLRQYTELGFQPSQLHIFLHDPLSEMYTAAPAPDENRPTTDLRFPGSSPLVQLFGSHREALFLGDFNQLPEELQPEQARLVLLGCQLYIPLPGRSRLTGWMALGPRLSGEPYSGAALEFLEALSHQAALAVERAQVVVDLERRVREMNVLTRVAQGTNFTVAFDDILELLYTQTNQVIPARDFCVALYDRPSGALTYAFFLENDERMVERENHPIPSGQGLEMEIVRSQRPLAVEDYQSECRSRSLAPLQQGVFGWMGVPLNAGAETIGVVSLASRDPALAFTDEQRNLFQAIADQAAGAIVKTRLLQETERRARQLATLNEIGKGLTSTLELKPLLNRIMSSAAEILNCQAGSLFLVDKATGELVFEVVIGPVAESLEGKRLPPGTGIVGEAVLTRQGIIANDAKRSKAWFDQPDEQTGFSTHDLLVVPMQLKDEIIGVIEVINKADGSPFNQSDQDLLTTFSSQATVAIENARLYTLTDQTLAARVEELSVMQRIDRELNASLDIDRALQLTLEWSMRQSHSDAGLVGIVDEGRVRVMNTAGYPKNFSRFQASPLQKGNSSEGRYLPENLLAVTRALQTGAVENLTYNAVGAGSDTLLPAESALLEGARAQLVIPIRREAHVIGLLLLESVQADTYSADSLAFLSRLVDHAAIAIANAQLYREVQAANMAKSQFVRFVAHELKNPMASIKGYTELVANGMAGPVNEMQSSFLATVRSNVDRMNTIVSDLNDLTQIQVGSLRLTFQPVVMQEVFQEAVRSLHQSIEEKDQNLEVSMPDVTLTAWGDPVRLGQIMTNLISNAHKYTRSGGALALGAELCLDEGGSDGIEVIHIWVKDTGIGIPAEDHGKIFQEYFRTDISKDTASGTGLGLNITRRLVEMQGGRIWFESDVNKGTTFHFTVPVAEAV
jgi:signal transduction histidine kinase